MNIKLILMMERVRSFFKREEGASAIEYALIAGLIAVGIIVASGDVRDAIVGVFGDIKSALDSVDVPTGG